MTPGPGAELARRYFEEVVEPILARHHPDLRYAAGRLGTGSDVLGFDDDLSRDHDWGLRLSLVIEDEAVGADVRRLLDAELPATFAGHPTRFPLTSDPTATHRVGIATTADFARSKLGVDPAALGPDGDPGAWLALTGQGVLEVVAGPVFRDTDGTLTALRERLRWYPDDVWHHLLAENWHRLAEELPFVGRTADVGDDRGSRIITARLAEVLVHQAFLVERTWVPYAKWTGTAFARLPLAATAGPPLAAALAADDGPAREQALVDAIEGVHAGQVAAGLPGSAHPVVPFFDRPYRTVDPELSRDRLRRP